MIEIAFDCETYKIGQQGKADVNPFPRLVCAGFKEPGQPTELLDRADACRQFYEIIARDDTVLIGHNTPFDMIVMVRACHEEGYHDVLDHVIRMYDGFRVHDTQIREQLTDLATKGIWGGYNLTRVAGRHGAEDRSDQKKGADIWRLRYNELEGVPIDEYPDEARDYAIADVDDTMLAYQSQKMERTSKYGYLAGDKGVVNEAPQNRAGLALGFTRANGLAVDNDYATQLKDEYDAQYEALNGYLRDVGIIRPDGVMDDGTVRSLMGEAFELAGITDEEITRTKTGKVAADKKAFERIVDSGVLFEHERLERLAIVVERRKVEKYISTYMEPLVDCFPYAIFPSYFTLKETGRTSSAGPNVQNFPKHDKYPLYAGPIDALYEAWGAPAHIDSTRVRKCFVPRPGNVFVDVDYSTLELRTLAQVIHNFGISSELLAALNSGRDVHLHFGCALLGIKYEEGQRRRKLPKTDPLKQQIEQYRFLAKAFNFGLPGGMGARKFQTHCRMAFGIDMTLDEINRNKRIWMQTWPEIPEYFNLISTLEFEQDRYYIRQHGPKGANQTWRVRRARSFPVACNTLFQGLAADGCKTAYWEIFKACYHDESSPLYGWRINAFVHDEFLIEGPEAGANAAANELSRLMIDNMQIHTPDVLIEAEPAISRRWDVKAESELVDGVWSIYEPQAEAA